MVEPARAARRLLARHAVLLGVALPACCANHAPHAVITQSAFIGVAPTTVTFDGSGSYDPDGKVRAFQWKLDGAPVASTPTFSHDFDAEGVFSVQLTVTDDKGAKSAAETATVAMRGISLDLQPLSGVVGDGTTIFRAQLPAALQAPLQSISVIDPQSTGGADGEYSGDDIDAVTLSSTLCDSAGCAATAPDLAAFGASALEFFPGAQRPPIAPQLFGTGAAANLVDTSVATPNTFGATFETGFLSLGVGGLLRLMGPIAISSPTYLYVGAVNDDEGAPDVVVYGEMH